MIFSSSLDVGDGSEKWRERESEDLTVYFLFPVVIIRQL